MTVAPSDLGTYLGIGAAIDTARATYLIAQATNLALSVVTPLPATADPVILDVAARAYTNPSSVQTESMGPFSATFGGGNGGLFLTRENKRTLRRLAGGSAAYSISTAPTAPSQLGGLPFWDWDVNAANAAVTPPVP